MGKSASGKDTIFQKLKEEKGLGLRVIVPYTTRPIREGEEEGREYYFLSRERFLLMEREGKIMESRTYQTVHGEWTYFTADDGQIDMDGGERYLLIGTLETYLKIREFYRRKLLAEGVCGEDGNEWVRERLKAIYIEVEDGMRLERALKRERSQEVPRYAELCRRFLADEEDFSEEKLAAAGIAVRFENTEIGKCMGEICRYIENG
jgi:guanylate kinase